MKRKTKAPNLGAAKPGRTFFVTGVRAGMLIAGTDGYTKVRALDSILSDLSWNIIDRAARLDLSKGLTVTVVVDEEAPAEVPA